MLAAWAPRGIERLHILTALGELPRTDDELQLIRDDFISEVYRRSQTLASHFNEAGIPADYEVAEEDLTDALERVTASLSADLVIVGARGHGFLERLMIGSSSLQVVLTAPTNVLLIRDDGSGKKMGT
jgi:nucleotide-binding universal stress UspA family protein